MGKERKQSANFFTIGSYKTYQAALLVGELQRKGIGVEILYSQPSAQDESNLETDGAVCGLMVRGSDLKQAEEIREKLGIYPLGPD